MAFLEISHHNWYSKFSDNFLVNYFIVSLDKANDLILLTAESPNISEQTSSKLVLLDFLY